MHEDETMYEDLIKEGADICDLLRHNSWKCGTTGELLELAADEIERLRLMATQPKRRPTKVSGLDYDG